VASHIESSEQVIVAVCSDMVALQARRERWPLRPSLLVVPRKVLDEQISALRGQRLC